MPSEGEVKYYVEDKTKLAYRIIQMTNDLEELKRLYYKHYGLTQDQKRARYSGMIVIAVTLCFMGWVLSEIIYPTF
jgi:hypothetical protein